MTVERNRRKTKVGVVVSDKMDKTVVVAIEDFVRELRKLKFTMKTTNARLAIRLELWKQDLYPRTRDGDLLTLSKRLNKGGTRS